MNAVRALLVGLVIGWADLVRAEARPSDAAQNNSEMMNAAPAACAQVRAGGVKVLFLGNSITLHGPLASIGWTNDWGMAASAPEKDFVHLVTRGIGRETGREVDLRVRNLADFERGFETWDAAKELSEEIAFEPDYLVVALGENVKWLGDEELRSHWRTAFRKMLGCFFTGRRRPFAVVRGVFWPCDWKDRAMAHAASDCAVPFARADFGDDPAMKAIGLFPHAGIQAHPGDRGMAAIAGRILETLFPTNAGYSVTANGVSVRVRPIRVSAMPYNAWRPGYQRPMDQTEIAGMAHVQSDGPLTFRVRPDRAFSRATVRPLSKKVKPAVADGVVAFTVPGPGQYVLELDDWHRPLEIFVDPVRDFAKERAEATVVFGPGRHEPVVVKLRSHDRVYIDRDAIVCGSFQADGVEDVRISGYGVICGSRNRRHEIDLPREAPGTCYRDGQDAAIRIIDSRNVTVEGPTVIDSCCWCVEAFRSSDLVFDRVKVTGAWRYNTDGIDICNSQRVVIRDCYVHSFDDSIVLKGIPEDRDRPVEDIRVERCVCWCGWGRTLEIGYETWAPHYRGIVFEDCDLIRNFGGALSVHLGGDATVEDAAYRRIRIEYGPHDLPQILQKDRDAPYPGKPGAVGYWLMVSNDKMYKEGGGFYGAKAELAKLPHGTFGRVTLEDIDVIVEPGGRPPATSVSPEKGTAFGTLSVSNVRLNGKPWDPLAPVPRLVIDGRECAMLSKAFSLMREAVVTEPAYGFTEPFFPPGAAYGRNWWQLDSSTVLEAWKWCDFGFCKRSVENFRKVQRPDGRIPLWGCDRLANSPHHSRQKTNVSSLPVLFKTAHSLATMADDPEFARRMYELNSRYLGWWRSNRVDRTTGLVSSVFEETFPPWLGISGEYAGVDTGVLVALGAEWTAEMADSLGKDAEAEDLRAFSARTFAAMRARMWDGRTGLFRPYRFATSALGFESAEGFYMFADRQLEEGRRMVLLRSLTGPRFAWGRMPLASMAVDSPHYTNTVGRTYQANASWSGNVWSLINRWTVHALLRAGCEREAVELALATKRMIDRAGTFDEFYLTTDGSAQGGEKYLWTAADYAILVIEDLLGISYDGKAGELRVRPRIKADFRLENLSLPDGSRATVSCVGGKVTIRF